MTRAEHLARAKQHALECLDAGEPLREAVTSMLSDLRKHPELERHAGGTLGVMYLMGGHFRTPQDVRDWIEGFN